MPKAEGAPATTKAAAPAAPTQPAQQTTLPAGDDWFAPIEAVEDHVNVVYYGAEGSTKTTSAAFLANLPQPGKVLFINAEGGVKRGALARQGVKVEDIVIWPDPRRPIAISHKSVDEVYRRVKSDLERDPESWKGVVLDSATDLHITYLDYAQGKRVNAIKMSGKQVDEEFVDIADYGTMSKMFRDTMRKFRDLPCHVVITALERRDVDKDTGKPKYGPAVTPGVQTDLLGYVDFVIMMKGADEDGPVRGLTRANSRYRAKDRFGVLPRVMVEPTMDRIIAYLQGDLAEDTDEKQQDLTPTAAPDAPTKPPEPEDDSAKTEPSQ